MAVLAVYPIFFILSFTFMTDVPFVACMIAASLAFVLALRQQSTGWLTLAALFMGLSIAMRFTGVALGAAFGMILLFHAGGWGRRRVWIALLPLASTILLIVWRQSHMVSPENATWIGPASRLAGLEYALPLLPESTIVTLPFLSSAVGLALLPLAIAISTQKNVQRAALIFAVIAITFVFSHLTSIDVPLPLVPGSMWALDELGLTMPLVPGFAPFTAPGWIYWLLCVLGWTSTSVLIANLVDKPSVAEWFFLWSIFFGAALIAVLWLFHDRCALPIVIPLIVLSARQIQTSRFLWALSAVVVFAVNSTFQTRDHLNYSAALYSALEHLQLNGVHDSEINGGYAMNGWNQYAHPENAPRDRFGSMYVPWVNSKSLLRYEISNSRTANAKVLAAVPYKKWVGRSGKVYVLDRGPRVQ